jgi:hypothetical protein
MLRVGFFEDLPSQRAIAARCDDSRAICELLGDDLTEATPEQSSFPVIRPRLPLETIEAVRQLVRRALGDHGLLRRRRLGIDSSLIEANASLRALEYRNPAETDWDYVKKLAAEAGIDPQDTKAVRRFDKPRPGRKSSNQEWVPPRPRGQDRVHQGRRPRHDRQARARQRSGERRRPAFLPDQSCIGLLQTKCCTNKRQLTDRQRWIYKNRYDVSSFINYCFLSRNSFRDLGHCAHFRCNRDQ